jgi:hypothetical protein
MQSNVWSGSKKFGLAQKLLGPVEGQGKTLKKLLLKSDSFPLQSPDTILKCP